MSTYAPCPDIRKKITPDLKSPALGQKGCLLLIDLSGGKMRLGGSALAQCFKQLGDSPPDMDDAKLLSRAFNATQKLIKGMLTYTNTMSLDLISLSNFHYN